MNWKEWKVEEPREVEVRDDKERGWQKRVIHHSRPDGVCACFNDLTGFPGYFWSQWRELPKKVIKPFDALPPEWAGKVVKHKEWNEEFWTTVLSFSDGTISIAGSGSWRLDDFAQDWETTDGKPCGIEVQE